jgi:hypothetical protein
MKRFLVLLVVAACGVDNVSDTATCGNGVQDGDETDVDCGGACGICEIGQTCLELHDCFDGSTAYVSTCSMEQGDDAPRCIWGVKATFPVNYDSPSTTSYCTGSTCWYQDYYTNKWCTASTLETHAHGWDRNACSWQGWKSVNGTWWYCEQGHLWSDAYTHYHCP